MFYNPGLNPVTVHAKIRPLTKTARKMTFVVWQDQALSKRQPLKHVTNLPMGVSPPSRQQQALGASAAFQAGHQQSLSMERITPTPSPVVSSSTDMPYSPSMRSEC